jgi:voltage-gated potassium channel
MKRIWNEILTTLAVLFLISFSYPAFDRDISAAQKISIEVVQWICWTAFAIDLIFGLLTAESKKRYLKLHPLEIASVILPFLRPLRLLRVISFGGLAIQRIAIGRQFAITIKVAITAIFVAYVSAVQITLIERSNPESNIKDFGDGLWWAISTVMTVGYGDLFPTTSQGRLLATFLMVMGISLVGVITASVAAWFVKLASLDSDKK